MQEKNTGYLHQHYNEIKKIADRYDLDEREVFNILTGYFDNLSKHIKDPGMPKILIPLFGSFKPRVKKINYYIRRYIRDYREGKVKRETVFNIIKRLWPVRNRIINENQGKETWKEWRKK